MIFFIRLLFNIPQKFPPMLPSNLIEQQLVVVNNFILVHLWVQLTEVPISLSWLPTLIMLTLINPHHMRFVLPKVKCFSRVDLRPNWLMEIFIWYLSISIHIKFIKYQWELLVSQIQTPMLKVKFQLLRFNKPGFLLIQVYKCFPYGFPLCLNFINNGSF